MIFFSYNYYMRQRELDSAPSPILGAEESRADTKILIWTPLHGRSGVDCGAGQVSVVHMDSFLRYCGSGRRSRYGPIFGRSDRFILTQLLDRQDSRSLYDSSKLRARYVEIVWTPSIIWRMESMWSRLFFGQQGSWTHTDFYQRYSIWRSPLLMDPLFNMTNGCSPF